MPSKGNPVLHTRVSPDLLAEIEAQLASLRAYGRKPHRDLFGKKFDVDWDIARFVRQAIKEKLAKMKRSRARRRSRALDRHENPSREGQTV